MFEKERKHLGKGDGGRGRGMGALFMDLSKAVDSLQHDLLLTKLNVYGFSYKSIKLTSSFLSERRFTTKINSEYSDWEDLSIGVRQGSVLGPLLFNIYMYDLFFSLLNQM